mgnify:CR=1 FL=1
MENQFERTELLLGKDAIQKLKNAHVAVFGVGGVGGFVVEELVRSGVGEIDVIDKDTVSLSNINRQIIALHSTVGQPKVEVIKNRALDINPNVKINAFETFFLPDTADMFDFSKYDYVVDAVDTVTAKKPYTLENGTLSVTGSTGSPVVVATGVTLAGANSTNLYFLDNNGASLKCMPLEGIGGDTLVAATQIGPGSAGALSMTVTENGVVIVAADHSMIIVNLTNNSYSYQAAPSTDVVLGLLVGTKLYYYTQDQDGVYHVAGQIDLQQNGLALATSTPATRLLRPHLNPQLHLSARLRPSLPPSLPPPRPLPAPIFAMAAVVPV